MRNDDCNIASAPLRRRLAFFAVVLALVGAAQPAVRAGDSDTADSGSKADSEAWPPSLDAVAAAPESHRVLLENDQVRVLEVVIRPGEKEPPHTHRWPSVMHVQQRSRIRYYDRNGDLTFETPTSAELSGPAGSQWMEPEGLHAVENIGDQPFRAIRVELKVVDGLTNRVWMQRDSDRPGAIRVFLADGTLLMDSCWETFRLERWRRKGESVSWTEDTAEVDALIVSIDEDELVLELQLNGGVERQEFVAAEVPYLCPGMPKGVAQEVALPLIYGCDDPAGESFSFSVRYLDEAVELGLPPRFERPGLTLVPQARAASGSKYERDGVLFWVAGERVRLDVDGASFGPCAERPSEPSAQDPWERARAEGVTFRALGQEPFWKLDVVPGRWMRFELLGAEPVSTPVPEATAVDGSTVYHAVTEEHELAVEIEPSVCHDSMSGHEFEATVTVTLDDIVYRGCGRVP